MKNIILAGVGLLMLLSPNEAWVQESSTGISVKDLESRVSGTEANESIDEASKSALLARLQEALGYVKQRDQFESEEDQFREVLDTGSGEIRRIQGETELLDDFPNRELLSDGLNESSEMSQIEEAMEGAEIQLADARSELKSADEKVGDLRSKPTIIRTRLIAASAELVEVEREISRQGGDGSSSEGELLMGAENLVLVGRKECLNAEIGKLGQESLSHELRSARAGAEKVLAEKKVEVFSSEITKIQNFANSRLNSEVDKAEALFRKLKQHSPEIDSPIAGLVSEMEKLIEETRKVSGQLQAAAIQFQEREATLRSLTSDSTSVQRQVEIGGLEGIFGAVLLEHLRGLPGRLEERQRVREIRQKLSEAQRIRYSLENEFEKVLPESDVIGAAGEEIGGANHTAVQLVQTRNRLLEDLMTNNRRLLRELGSLDLIEHQIEQESSKYKDYLAEQLFWVRSSSTINSDTFRGLISGLKWAYGADRPVELIRQFRGVSVWVYIAVLFPFACLLIARGKFRRILVEAGERTYRVSTDHYSNTVKSALMTFLLALPVPLLFVSIGAFLRYSSRSSEWSSGLGFGLLAVGHFLIAGFFLKGVSREKGLGECHLGWDAQQLKRLRQFFRLLIPIYVPVAITLSLVIAEKSSEHLNGLGRLTALVGVIGVGAIFAFVYRSAFSRGGESGSYLSQRLIFWANIGISIWLIALLALGYVVTALYLIAELQVTLLAILSAIVVYGMVIRWFEIKTRRLALADAIEKRRARREEAQSEEEENSFESEEMLTLAAENEQRVDFVAVGEQTRSVVKFLVGTALLFLLWRLWTEFVPILTVLDRVEPFGKFSIADIAVSAIVIGLTISVSRNLAGLLEMFVFRKWDIVPGKRSSVTTLVRYGVIATGAAVFFRQIGVDWSQFSWIAAALSVGLGFGLQEVVANFVCGIILLFEQPIRVGDVVTVGGVSGSVSKIQMRATTIVNWDREEFVVPNKEFITGSLINSTLSSPVNRVLIPVGVAYGSDTEKVLKILTEVTAGNKDVMEDPSPVISFERFGESSLDFVVRAYLPNRENRLGVITDLHREIDRRFAEAEIEIPFPQRDLHVRSVVDGAPITVKPKS